MVGSWSFLSILIAVVFLSFGCNGDAFKVSSELSSGSPSATPTPGATPGSNSNWTAKNSSRVFLSGHSLTDNPLIDYVEDIAAKKSDSFNYNQQIGIGSPIRVRTKGGNPGGAGFPGYSDGKNRAGATGLNIVQELLNPATLGVGEKYETLVLTENHNLLDMIQWESTVEYVRHYHDRLVAGNSAGRTLLYHSWLDVNKADPTAWIAHEKHALIGWECVASKVNHSLATDLRNDRVVTLPTGAALVDLVERIVANQVTGIAGTTSQKMDMIFSDNVHLTNLGVYFAASVTYAAVFGKTPVGASAPGGLNAGTVADLQTIAWNFVNTYYSRTNPGVRTMAECRTHFENNLCSSYWNLKASAGSINGCRNYFGSSNANSPLRWPDANWTPFPAP